MTNFWTLFKQMWSQKQRYIYLVFFINVFAIIFISLMTTMTKDYDMFLFWSPKPDLAFFWRSNFATLTLYFDVAFCGITCWQNEKINMSQTWHLAAADERKTYFVNIFSSLMACAWFFLLQQIVNAILLIPIFGANGLVQAFRDFQLWPAKYVPWPSVLYHWIFIVLIISFIYVFVSFANFTSRIIADILPFKSTLWIRLFIIAILVVVAVYSGTIITSHLDSLINTKMLWKAYDLIWLDDLLLVAVSLILGLLDLWFVKKFIEPKIKNI